MSRLWPRNRLISSRSSVITLIKIVEQLIHRRPQCESAAGNAQTLLHDGAGGGVLQELALLRKQVMLNGERRERGFMKAAQDELLLAGIGVDVADGEDSRDAGLELLGIHLERPLLQLHAPLGDGARASDAGRRKRERDRPDSCSVAAVGRVHLEPGELVVVPAQADGVALQQLASCRRATNSRMRATVAGAARNSARRCSKVSERAFSHSATVQSSAESPPPQITRSGRRNRRPTSRGSGRSCPRIPRRRADARRRG